MLNPSPHTAVLAALTQPELALSQYDAPPSPNKGRRTQGKATSTQQHGLAPDTCILFQRYLESGKTINLYDWYESFVSALAGEIRESQESPTAHSTPDRTPTKRKKQVDNETPTKRSSRNSSPAKGKGKSATPVAKKDVLTEDDQDSEIEDPIAMKEKEKELEAWRREVYARFMRSVHELDYMGFIRWSGKGAGKKGSECVGKLVWGGGDYE